MGDFEIIDAHAHLSRTLEEDRNYYLFTGRPTKYRWGTPERAMEYMDIYGISKAIILTLLPRQYRGPLVEKAKLQGLPEEQRRKEEARLAEQVAPIMREFNEWGCEMGKRFPRLIPFSSISKELGGAKGMVAELELRASQGARGVKFQPGMFCFFPYDEDFFPLYEKCQELGLPIVADSGLWPTDHNLTVFFSPVATYQEQAYLDYTEPKHWAPVLEAFPRLTVVLAHLGSAWWDERIELAQKYPNVFFDTSQGFSAPDRVPYTPHRGLAEADIVRVFRKIGVERIMFGTDFPALPRQDQIEQLMRVPLTDEEKRMLFSENAKRILKI